MMDKPLWMARVWKTPDGLRHVETYDFETQEYSEEWHPDICPECKDGITAWDTTCGVCKGTGKR